MNSTRYGKTGAQVEVARMPGRPISYEGRHACIRSEIDSGLRCGRSDCPRSSTLIVADWSVRRWGALQKTWLPRFLWLTAPCTTIPRSVLRCWCYLISRGNELWALSISRSARTRMQRRVEHMRIVAVLHPHKPSLSSRTIG
jgi:hypothetical protein